MHEDPLVDAHRHEDRREAHRKMFEQAVASLQQDFMRAIAASPRAEVNTPHDVLGDTMPMVNVVLEMIENDEEDLLLASMLQCVVRAAHAGDREAMHLIEDMARKHAAFYANEMGEAGDFAP